MVCRATLQAPNAMQRALAGPTLEPKEVSEVAKACNCNPSLMLHCYNVPLLPRANGMAKDRPEEAHQDNPFQANRRAISGAGPDKTRMYCK